MSAGPNGSGKSTIKSAISPALCGIYINPDEIEAEIRQRGYLDLAAYGVETKPETFRTFLRRSGLIEKAGLHHAAEAVRVNEGNLSFNALYTNAYLPQS